MISSRPYLIRAFYDWIVDNNWTPYIVINVEEPGVQVPQHYIKDGKIVLNISPTAVQDLDIGHRLIEFNARFGGTVLNVYAPVRTVLAIYARENDRGMVFTEEDSSDDLPPPEPPKTILAKRPKLTVVK